MRTITDYLLDLEIEINAVAAFTRDGRDVFMADERTQYAVMMAYARIGEIAKRIPNNLLATQPQAEWTELKGFRDVLLHRYFEIAPERIWEAVQKLPILRTAVEALLASLPPEDEDDA